MLNVTLESLKSQIPEFLPPHTRAVGVSLGDNNNIRDPYPSMRFLVELEPRIYPLNLGRNGFSRTAPKTISAEVAMPWQYFIFSYSKYRWQHYYDMAGGTLTVYILWSKKRVQSLDEELIPAKLPDVEPKMNAWVCLGYLDKFVRDENISGTTSTILRDFFGFSQGTELHGGYHFPAMYETLEQWAEDSAKDPACFLKWTDFDADAKISLRTFFPKASTAGVQVEQLPK